MTNVVLDASALLAILQQERGADRVIAAIEDADSLIMMSSVNFCEVATRLVKNGLSPDDVRNALVPFRQLVVDFGSAHAEWAGELHRKTISFGLSLGDRACFALADERDAMILTSDREWKKVKIGIEVELIR